MTSFDIVGYTASALLITSFMLKDIVKLRLVNSAGCAFFIAFGFMDDPDNWPIIITNAFIICANFYHLIRDRRTALNEN